MIKEENYPFLTKEFKDTVIEELKVFLEEN